MSRSNAGGSTIRAAGKYLIESCLKELQEKQEESFFNILLNASSNVSTPTVETEVIFFHNYTFQVVPQQSNVISFFQVTVSTTALVFSV